MPEQIPTCDSAHSWWHLQIGSHSVHTSSVALPAASLSPTLKVLIPKYLQGEARQLFNTLQPQEDRASDIDGVVSHRDWITATLTQLSSFLFSLTYPLFISFSGPRSSTLTMVNCQSIWGPLSTWTFFSSLWFSLSYPISPRTWRSPQSVLHTPPPT